MARLLEKAADWLISVPVIPELTLLVMALAVAVTEVVPRWRVSARGRTPRRIVDLL